jgi:hypothetical protein
MVGKLKKSINPGISRQGQTPAPFFSKPTVLEPNISSDTEGISLIADPLGVPSNNPLF